MLTQGFLGTSVALALILAALTMERAAVVCGAARTAEMSRIERADIVGSLGSRANRPTRRARVPESRSAGWAGPAHAGPGRHGATRRGAEGHALRLEVSSSNFPRFDRNLNTGEENARGKRFVPATNTVLHDTEHPSALVLPVVSR